jgi:hypothetical protein
MIFEITIATIITKVISNVAVINFFIILLYKNLLRDKDSLRLRSLSFTTICYLYQAKAQSEQSESKGWL